MSDEFAMADERDTLVGTAMEQFEISQKIGEGSIGTIYKAFDLINQRDVAVKFLTREVTSSPQVLERFKREIQTTLKMGHPNIVKGFTAGVWEGCIYYYVMEYVDGSTLSDLMARQRITEELAVEITFQMAQALKYINEFGMVHRDLKPENIMITREGQAKLTDLGLAKAKDDMSGVTLAGTIIGTPLYMSPEQAKGSSIIDIRADIYSLGATIYHLVTGEPPFKGNSAPVVIAKQINEVPKPVRELNPALSPGFEYVIAKSMEKDPARRYQKPQDLISDLVLLQEGKGQSTDTNVPWGMVAAEAKEKQFHFAYYPNEEDFEFALTAVANKLISREKVAEILDFQEEMAKQGAPLKLAYLSVEQGHLEKNHAAKIKAAQRKQRHRETGSEFGNLSVKNRFVTEAQVQEALEVQEEVRSREEKDKLLGTILKDLGYIDDRQISLILSQQKAVKHSGEDRLFQKLALKMNLVAKPLVEKARVIQQNEVAMGKYREIGDILLERKYISQGARNVIMRAIRRKHLTKESLDVLIGEKDALISDEKTTATVHVDTDVLRKYFDRIDGLVAEGRRFYKKRDFEEALRVWSGVFEILAAHEETEKLIRKTRDIVENLEGHLAQASNFFELALREWNAVLKIRGDYPAAVSGLGKAARKLGRLLPDGAASSDPRASSSGEVAPSPPRGKTVLSPEAETPPDGSEAEEPSEEERRKAKVQRMLKHAKRSVKDGRTGKALDKLAEILAFDSSNKEALALKELLWRRQRRTTLICLLLIVLVLGGALAGAVAVIGPDETKLLLIQILGTLADLLRPAA